MSFASGFDYKRYYWSCGEVKHRFGCCYGDDRPDSWVGAVIYQLTAGSAGALHAYSSVPSLGDQRGACVRVVTFRLFYFCVDWVSRPNVTCGVANVVG